MGTPQISSRRFEQKGQVPFLTFSPDGATLAFILGPFNRTPEREGKVILLRVTTGKDIHKFPTPQQAWQLAFSPSGTLLAISYASSPIRLWDLAQGKQVRVLEGLRGGGMPLAFSPNGKVLAAQYVQPGKDRFSGDDLHIWDVGTGKLLRHFGQVPHGSVSVFAFSADGKTLLAEHCRTLRPFSPRHNEATWEASVHLWDVTLGKDLGQVGNSTKWTADPRTDHYSRLQKLRELGVFPDGQHIGPDGPSGQSIGALGGGFRIGRCANGTILVFPRYEHKAVFAQHHRSGAVGLVEAETGKELAKFTDFEGGMLRAVTLSPDERTLAAAGEVKGRSTSTVIIWDLSNLTARAGANTVAPTHQALASLWIDLAADDTVKAHRAMRTLARFPRQSLPFLTSRFLPPPRQVRIPTLIAALESKSFRARERAAEELGQGGSEVVRALEKVLAGHPSVEVRRRIERILASIKIPSFAVEKRGLRLVDVLEHIGTADARQLLKTLQRGSLPRSVVQAAKASLARLEEKSPPRP